MSTLQPYVRRLLIEALQAPTPALVHAVYCHPMAFALLGVARGDVVQPLTLDDITDRAKVWLRRARDGSRVKDAKKPNWLVVIPLVAWTRHLACLDDVDALVRTVEALLAVYGEAFLHAQMPHLPDPTEAGGVAPSSWAASSKPAASFGTVLNGSDQSDLEVTGPVRFMVEFMGLVETLWQRFGPGVVLAPTKTLLAEFVDERLVETAWFMQLLRFFGRVTRSSKTEARWLQECATEGLSSILVDQKQNRPPHPKHWSLTAWHAELQRLGLARALLRAFRAVLAPNRSSVRKPKWTAALLALLRDIWRNILLVNPAPPLADGHLPALAAALEADERVARADALVLDLAGQGAPEFLMVDLLGAGVGNVGGAGLSAIRTTGGPEGIDQAYVRDAGLALLEDVVCYGRGHRVLVQSIIAQMTKRFVDAQVRLLCSSVPGVQESAVRLFRILSSFESPQVDLHLQHSDVRQHLPKSLGPPLRSAMSGDDSQVVKDLKGHPLALHHLQVGELVGGLYAETADNGVSTSKTVSPPSRMGPSPPGVGKTEVIVPPRRRAPTPDSVGGAARQRSLSSGRLASSASAKSVPSNAPRGSGRR